MDPVRSVAIVAGGAALLGLVLWAVRRRRDGRSMAPVRTVALIAVIVALVIAIAGMATVLLPGLI